LRRNHHERRASDSWLESPEHVIRTEFQNHRIGIVGDRSVQSGKAHCSLITTHAGIGDRRRLTSRSQCTFKFGRKGIDGKDNVPGSERIPDHDDPDRPVFGTNVMVEPRSLSE